MSLNGVKYNAVHCRTGSSVLPYSAVQYSVQYSVLCSALCALDSEIQLGGGCAVKRSVVCSTLRFKYIVQCSV